MLLGFTRQDIFIFMSKGMTTWFGGGGGGLLIVQVYFKEQKFPSDIFIFNESDQDNYFTNYFIYIWSFYLQFISPYIENNSHTL